ncbi:hypothetical protein D3C81_1973250 [compost metagenome]
MAVTLHALRQVVLGGLLQRPVAVADHMAVVGEGEQPADALGIAQVNLRVGHGQAAEGEGGQGR